jgi:tight adherence protein B
VKRLLLIASLLLSVVFLPVAAWGAPTEGTGLQLTEAGGVKFPERAFVLSLPSSRSLTVDAISVTENGQSVAEPTLQPASAAGGTVFGAVLVVDASQSMEGRPLAAAMSAARAFAARRNPKELLALLTFSGAPTVALPITAAKDKIDAALSRTPAVSYGTHIFDAVGRAEALLRQSKIDAGSIVVLSDGADTGSTAKLADVATAARQEHIRIYTIGLHSPRFDPSTLTALAAQGGGDYALAKSTADLTPLFDQLGARLASEYLLEYKSLAGPKQPVQVAVKVGALGTARAAYQTPALPVKAVPAPYHESIGSRFWTSPIVMIVFALLAASVVAILLIGLTQPRHSGLPKRMAEFVSIPELQSRERRPASVAVGGNEGQAPSTGVFARLDETLEIAGIKTTAARLVLSTIVATLVLSLLLDLAVGSAWWALLALLVPLAVREYVSRKLAHRRKAFAEQLPDALQVISAALRAGQSFAGALAVVVESATEPMRSEMQQVVADEQLGVPLDKAVAVVVRRMASRDLEQVALVAQLQRESGGNAAEVVDRVAETIRERFDLQRLINTLTIQGRISRWIVSALPVALVLILSVINPHYLHPLVSTTGGKVMLIMAGLLVVAGSLVIKKIVDIRV